jgi:hypothetical protein
MMIFDYPTDINLHNISEYANGISKNSVNNLLDLLEEIWSESDDVIINRNDNKILLELHTRGWSGNEDIIGILQNTNFWLFFWQMSKRGGHFYFEINLSELS